MHVAFTGPRDLHIEHSDIQYAILNSGFKLGKILVGDARGIDYCVRRYANAFHPYAFEIFNAFWHQDGKVAGPNRNKRMIARADALIAFVRNNDKPCTSGTASAIAEAVIKGIPVHIVKV